MATQNNKTEDINTQQNYVHHRAADRVKQPVQNAEGSFYSISVAEACDVSKQGRVELCPEIYAKSIISVITPVLHEQSSP